MTLTSIFFYIIPLIICLVFSIASSISFISEDRKYNDYVTLGALMAIVMMFVASVIPVFNLIYVVAGILFLVVEKGDKIANSLTEFLSKPALFWRKPK